MDYRQPEFPRRSPEFARRGGGGGQEYYGDFNRQPQPYQMPRARSHNRVDPDYIPPDFSTYARPLDKSSRSKSLDYRDAFRDDTLEYDDRNRPRDRYERNYDYDRDIYMNPNSRKDERRGSREHIVNVAVNKPIDVPIHRGMPPVRDVGLDSPLMRKTPKALARSSEWLPPRKQYDDRGRSPYRNDGHSPKSIASGKQKANLNLSLDNARMNRVEQQRGGLNQSREDYRYGGGYGREEGRQMYESRSGGLNGDVRGHQEARGFEMSRSGGGGCCGGGASHSKHHSSYYHESHGGGGGAGGYVNGHSPGRRAITGPPQPQGYMGPPPRPIQHHRIKCCCFNFTWPPWSYEPTEPPQPIYRNI